METQAQTLDKILKHDGVLAVVIPGAAPVGDPQYAAILSHQLGLFDFRYMDDQTSFRVNIGQDNASILVMRSGGERIAIAVKSGHPVVKSCKRMARRALAKLAMPDPAPPEQTADPEAALDVTAP